MSNIPASAALIRLAVVNDGYAQDLFEAVDTNEGTRRDLVHGSITEDELAKLTPAEWQWYANWRQSLGGPLDRRLLDYLTAAVSTRFARFEVRALVLRDGRTNQAALEYDSYPGQDDTEGTLGLRWLSEQASGQRIENAFRPGETYWRGGFEGDPQPAERAPGTDERDWQESLESYDEDRANYFAAQYRASVAEYDELVTDALQCATDASWYLLRELMSDAYLAPYAFERSELVERRLNAFAEERGLNPAWYRRGERLRLDDNGDTAGGLATE
jgi:hypothetical protein